MPSPGQLLAFLPVAVVIVVVPGPSVLFVIGRALTNGLPSALITVLGNALGVTVQVIGIAFGFGVLLTALPWALLAMRVLGGCYLIWLGARSLLARVAHDPSQTAPDRSFRDGVIVGMTNPKSLLFLSAFLPQFVRPEAGVVTQILALGAIFVGVALLGDSLWAVAAARARELLSGRGVRTARVCGGMTLIALGGYTLVAGHRPG